MPSFIVNLNHTNQPLDESEFFTNNLQNCLI
nr:MAG TPA: hypothetical protein [Caudoviricetes sp.]